MDASLDSYFVVDDKSELVLMSPGLRALLKLRPKSGAKNKKFCDSIELSVCKKGCVIDRLLESGEDFRFDETPAVQGDSKMRLTIKGVPIYSANKRRKKPIGAIVTVRDTSGEIIVQAKYHKALNIISEKEEEIAKLEDKIQGLLRSLRNTGGLRM